jgi:hypothetical protein
MKQPIALLRGFAVRYRVDFLKTRFWIMVTNDTKLPFSQQHLRKLQDFVEIDLLSSIESSEMLKEIVIVDEDEEWDGSWSAKRTESGIVCVIQLNIFFVKDSLSLDEKIESLKTILAHEHGHHWTLSHLMNNFSNFNYLRDRLPVEYYALRGLDKSKYSAFYINDSFEAWCRCDKEIIAEDYKFLFAPEPHGNFHRIVEEALDSILLENPSELVSNFIRRINMIKSLL